MKGIKLFLFCIFLGDLLMLQGCVSTAVSGAQAIYNRQSIQKSINDQYITLQANKAIFAEKSLKGTNISIATLNGEVLLAGQAPTFGQRNQAEALIRKIPNIEELYNKIEIAGPSSALVRMSDAWITTKVKSQLIASNDLDASQIKVVTENGTVYLMGLLRPSEARAAAEIASQTKGVEKVVKIFSYMRISKT